MDIFTTQLTRVVPIPIKPAKLKVKALLKDAASSGLSEDLNHLENHEYYFAKEEAGEDKSNQKKDDETSKMADNPSMINSDAHESENQENEELEKVKNTSKDKHFDLYA